MLRKVVTIVIGLSLAACGAVPVARPVSIVATSADVRTALRQALREPMDPRVLPTVAELPAPAAPPDLASVHLALARARTAYVDTLDFASCTRALEDPAWVEAALASGERGVAARVLIWRAACALAAGDEPAAAAQADAFAAMELPIPDGIDEISPRVESIIAQARRSSTTGARGALIVHSDPPEARLSVDGVLRPDGTTRLELPVGDHVLVADADARAPQTRTVRVGPDDVELRIELGPASPQEASADWFARWSTSPAADAWPSLSLLRIATRSRSVALVQASATDGDTLTLRAALAVDDDAPLRAERRVDRSELASGARELLAELFRAAGITPPTALHEEPLFWGAIVLAAALAGGVVAAIVYQPEVRSDVVIHGSAR